MVLAVSAGRSPSREGMQSLTIRCKRLLDELCASWFPEEVEEVAGPGRSELTRSPSVDESTERKEDDGEVLLLISLPPAFLFLV